MNRRPWTMKELQMIMEADFSKTTLEEIAQQLGRSTRAVQEKRYKEHKKRRNVKATSNLAT